MDGNSHSYRHGTLPNGGDEMAVLTPNLERLLAVAILLLAGLVGLAREGSAESPEPTQRYSAVYGPPQQPVKQLPSPPMIGVSNCVSLHSRLLAKLQGNVYALDSSADGRTLAVWVLGADLGVTLMDTAKGTVLQKIPAEVLPMALSPDGHFVATGTIPPPFQSRVAGPDVSLWEVGTPRRLALLHGLQAKITGLMFSPEGGLLASVTEDGILNLRRVPSGDGVWQLSAEGGVKQVAFSADGTLIAGSGPGTSRDEWTLGVWDVSTQRSVATLGRLPPLHRDERVRVLAFAPPGSGEVIFGTSQHVVIWHYGGPQSWVKRFEIAPAAVSPDGKIAVTIDSYVGGGPNGYSPVTLWDFFKGLPLVTKRSPEGTLVTTVAFSKDGRRLVCGTNGGEIIIWEH